MTDINKGQCIGSGSNVCFRGDVVVAAGGILMAAGLLPKFGALIASVPQPVIGGAGLIMFGMILAGGIGIIKAIEFNRRNTMILTLGVAAGLTVTYRPEIISQLPAAIQTIAGNGIALGAIVTVFANMVLPGERTVEEEPVDTAGLQET